MPTGIEALGIDRLRFAMDSSSLNRFGPTRPGRRRTVEKTGTRMESVHRADVADRLAAGTGKVELLL